MSTAVLGFHHFSFGGVLDEIKLKPFWEVWQSYCMRASVAAALFMLYLVTLTRIPHCIPEEPANRTSDIDFSGVEADFVNTYCSKQMYDSPLIAYCIVPLAMVIVIHGISGAWTSLPCVMNALNTFIKIEKDVETFLSDAKGDNPPRRLLDDVTEDEEYFFNEAMRKESYIRKGCFRLWFYKSIKWSPGVYALYIIKTSVVLIITLGCGVCGIILVVRINHDPHYFNCTLDAGDFNLTRHSLSTFDQYYCSYSIAKGLLPYMIFFTVSLFLQCLWCVLGMLMICRTRRDQNKNRETLKNNSATSFVDFVNLLRENSSPSHPDEVLIFIKYITSDKLFEIMKRKCCTDISLLKIYIRWVRDGVSEISKHLEENWNTLQKDQIEQMIDELKQHPFEGSSEFIKTLTDLNKKHEVEEHDEKSIDNDLYKEPKNDLSESRSVLCGKTDPSNAIEAKQGEGSSSINARNSNDSKHTYANYAYSVNENTPLSSGKNAVENK